MRTHGWSGSAPASDEEAIARILDAASKAIDARGADFSIADVARTLGVTRQTVYRYFPSTDALLVAAAVHAASDFLDRLAAHLQGITDPADAVAEAIATALEWLPKDKHLGLLIVPGRPNPHTESVTSDVALDFAHSMVRRFDVDWAGLGFTDADLDELAEHLLRIIQSFVIDPGRPPRQGEELRGYLRRWVGCGYTTVSGSDFRGSNTNVEPPLNLHHRDLAQFLCRRVGLDHPRRPVGVGSGHLARRGAGRRRRRSPAAAGSRLGATSEIQAPSSWAGERAHVRRCPGRTRPSRMPPG